MRARCFHCAYKNPVEMRFCGSCGKPLRVVCANCQATVPNARYCGNCGVPLNAAADVALAPTVPVSPERIETPAPSPVRLDSLHQQAVEAAVSGEVPAELVAKMRDAGTDIVGERRKVVVMFSDVSGFTAMSEKMDPEQIHTIMNECFDGLVKIVYKYEGYIDKFIGDCIMTLFGAPVAHEDDVARALFAILEMTDWLNAYSERLQALHGVAVGMHTGLNYGTVIAGGLGSDLRMDYTVIGDTVNVASRLESAAQRGQTFVSETVYAMGRRQFRFAEVEPLTLKGKSRPVPAFQVLAVRDDPEPLRGIEGFPSVLVGRDDELARLDELFAEAREASGRTVSLVGEPGAGKSRLVAEFLEHVREAGSPGFQAACLSYTQSVPYYVFRRLLVDWADVAESDPSEVVTMKLRRALEMTGEDLTDAEPFLLSLVGGVETEPLDGLDGQTRQRLTDNALVRAMLAAARERPVAFVLDDLHWADEASSRVLRLWAGRVSESHGLLMGLHRPEFASDWGCDRHATISLDTLSRGTIHALVDRLLGEDNDVSERLLDVIVQKSSGNPFFAEEVLRAFLDSGVLVREEGRWHLTQPPMEVAVPDSLHAVIMGRLDSLPEDARRILQVGSVIGQTFETAIFCELGWHLAGIVQHTERLTELQLLVETKPLPELTYAFKQEYIQEVSLGTLLLKTRRELHNAVGEAIERTYAERLREQVEVLAYHYAEGRTLAKAADYAKESATKAREVYANQAAIDRYDQMLGFADEMEPDDGAGAARIRLDAYEGKGDVLTLTGDYDDALTAFDQLIGTLDAAQLASEQRAVRHASALRAIGNVHLKRGNYDDAFRLSSEGLDALEALATEDATRERSRVTGQIGFIRLRTGDYEAADAHSRESLALAEQIDSRRDIAYACVVSGLASYHRGRIDEAVSQYRHALAVREEMGDITGVAAVLQNLGNLYLDQARYDLAEEHYQRCLEMRRKAGDIAGAANVLNQLGNVRLGTGDYAGTAEFYAECRTAFERLGNRFGLAVTLNNLGQTHLEQDDPETARGYLEQAIEAAEALKAGDLAADTQVALAHAELDAGNLARAGSLATTALERAREMGSKAIQARARWVLGRLAAAQGDAATGERELTASLELFRSVNMRLWEARALLERARVCQPPGRDADLQAALEAFRELGMARDIARAEALAADLRQPPASGRG
ncbi:tetratricopeptide repeat protein [Candidatus Poribacteria bacterium]|nr:tetratricopeptide repeat protein [Candidatus Poribacteria bacterium]